MRADHLSKNSGKLQSARLPKLLFYLIFLLPVHTRSVLSQSAADGGDVEVSFAKKSMTLPEATTVFNIVSVTNPGKETLKGSLFIRLPDSWPVIGAQVFDVSVLPGEKAFFPVRAGVPKNATGGVSYVMYAELNTSKKSYNASSYVSVQKKSKWEMKVLNSNVYLSEFRPVGNFGLKLENKGNSSELIKLDFDIGALLKFKTFIEADSVMFVELPAYSDTTMNFEVFRRKDLSYAENRALLRNWRATSVYIKASTVDDQAYSGVRFTPLESEVVNDMPMRNSPLNVDFTTYNLLSQQRLKASLKVHGKILFPDDQVMQYSFGMYNLYFNPQSYRNFDLYQQLRYMVRYNDRKSSIWIGDRLGVGNLHSMTGSGVKAEYSVSQDQLVTMNLIYNPYGGSIGTFAGYSRMIGKVNVNTGVTLERSNHDINDFYTFHLGGAYHFLRYHTLRLETASSFSSFSKSSYLQHDTTTLGFAYRLSYYFNNRKFRFHVDNMNTEMTYLNNSGINRIEGDLDYKINPSSRLLGMYYRNNYNPSHYPYNFYYPHNTNINENGRLLYVISNGNVIYQAGPRYLSITRNNFTGNSGTATSYKNYQPGLIGSVTFRLGGMRSITPNLSVSTMYVTYQDGAGAENVRQISGKWQYTAGLSYYDQAFRLSAYYTSGDATEIYRDLVVDDNPVISQAVYIRPSYERYFSRDRIKLNASYSYSYFMPSQRENTIASVMGSFSLKDGWNLYSSLNIYKNSRMDTETGRISTRSLNVMAGFRKAFDVQQPRMKYYDMLIEGFNDEDGDGVKDDNEKPVSNILINLKRDPDKNQNDKAGFAETRLITNPNGEIRYRNIPEGTYDLEITPLSNMEDLYFLEGRNQEMVAGKDRIHYLPLVESYKVKGKVIVSRDPNSNVGRISLEGIRVTATSPTGSVYSVLTGQNGSYILNLPRADVYTVSIFNVFGERFVLRQPSFEVQFMQNKTVQIDFRFDEIKREIKFDNGKPLFEFHLNKDE